MNATATRMLFAAVAVSALAAVLASSVQARIPEGTGKLPISRTVVNDQHPQGSGTFSVDPGFYAAMTSPTVAHERLARQGNGTVFVDAEICAALDRAIRVAIQQCSHAVPLAAKQIQTGAGQARLNKFPASYRGLA